MVFGDLNPGFWCAKICSKIQNKFSVLKIVFQSFDNIRSLQVSKLRNKSMPRQNNAKMQFLNNL